MPVLALAERAGLRGLVYRGGLVLAAALIWAADFGDTSLRAWAVLWSPDRGSQLWGVCRVGLCGVGQLPVQGGAGEFGGAAGEGRTDQQGEGEGRVWALPTRSGWRMVTCPSS